jgi:drug/metabolite transporter (DMT)-like permease
MIRLEILMFIAMLSWGATWVNAKILGSYLNSYELIFLRFLIASIALLPIIYFLKLKLNIGLKNFALAFSSGLLLVLYNYLFFKGCYYGDAGFGGVLVTTLNPIITFLLVSLISFKKISKKEAFALSLGAIGTMTILQIWSVGLNVWLERGVRSFLLASFTWPFITILSSYLKKR